MLKSLLSLLLSRFYSKQESELVGHQAMPSEVSIVITPTSTTVSTWTQVVTYKAPTDGYISARAMSNQSGAFMQLVAGDSTTNPSLSTCAALPNQRPHVTMPVFKGRNIAVYCSEMSGISVCFSRTIGGGTNS